MAQKIAGLPRILRGIADFVFLVKAQITGKRINLLTPFFMNYVRESVRNSLQYFIC